MRKLLQITAFLMLSPAAWSQKSEPCCGIIGIDPNSSTVFARNQSTGQLFSFQADPSQMRNLKLKDPVTASPDLREVTAISGNLRKYKAEPVNTRINYAEPANVKNASLESKLAPKGLVRFDNLAPCCGIINIEPDQAEPANTKVSIKNTAGHLYYFRAPASVMASVSKGSSVYMDEPSGYVILQSSYNSSDESLNSFAYPIESAENSKVQWTLQSKPDIKGVLGRLNMNFPQGVDWNIWIYKQPENNMVNSFYHTGVARSYSLSPGTYKILLSNVPVENVVIEKGKETSLKYGILNIVSEGDWALYDENKNKNLTSNTRPTKLALPVGSYQLKLGGSFYTVVIKDKETVDF